MIELEKENAKLKEALNKIAAIDKYDVYNVTAINIARITLLDIGEKDG